MNHKILFNRNYFWLYITFIIVFSIIIGTIIPYILIFNNGLSGDHSNWSSFGNYFSGVITPLFSALNLFILIIIAYKVNEWKMEENDRMLIKQQKILYSEWRNKVLNNFIDKLTKYESRVENNIKSIDNLYDFTSKIRFYINTFYINYSDLFNNENFHQSYLEFQASIDNLLEYYSQIIDDSTNYSKENQHIKIYDYYDKRYEVINIMQKIIINDLDYSPKN